MGMFRHVLRLIWNRRRASRLVVVEIAAAFLVTFVVCALSLHEWGNYRRPLGFTYENVWQVSVSYEGHGALPLEAPPGLRGSMDDIRAAIRRVPGVLGADSIFITPFADVFMYTMLGREGAPVSTMQNTLTAGGLADLGVRIVEGRSFGPEDEGQDYRAALVNRDFVNRAFGGASPLGRRINFPMPEMLARMTPEQARDATREIRAVGVIDDFRQYGEFTEKTPYVILLEDPHDSASTELLVKVAPGSQRRLEERIVAAVRGAAVGFKATVTPWEELRASQHLWVLLPLRIGATLAVFLLAMVALGLIGIVWQDVVRRTHEMGVRRAEGASAGAVRAQILLEVLVIGGTAIFVGSLVAIQIPLLSVVQQIDWGASLPALGVSAALILLLSAGAALYPALLASGLQPADALRYE
jgi:putative ABC transport system permease protein